MLKATEREHERAVERYALAASHPYVGNSRWFADIAGLQIEAAAEHLSEDVATAARERGRKADLWATAEALLAELEESP